VTFFPTSSTMPAMSTPKPGFFGARGPSPNRIRNGVPRTRNQSSAFTAAACTPNEDGVVLDDRILDIRQLEDGRRAVPLLDDRLHRPGPA
jgi:hypothetical protein